MPDPTLPAKMSGFAGTAVTETVADGTSIAGITVTETLPAEKRVASVDVFFHARQ